MFPVVASQPPRHEKQNDTLFTEGWAHPFED